MHYPLWGNANLRPTGTAQKRVSSLARVCAWGDSDVDKSRASRCGPEAAFYGIAMSQANPTHDLLAAILPGLSMVEKIEQDRAEIARLKAEYEAAQKRVTDSTTRPNPIRSSSRCRERLRRLPPRCLPEALVGGFTPADLPAFLWCLRGIGGAVFLIPGGLCLG